MSTNQIVKKNLSGMQVIKTLQLLLEDNYTMGELIEKLKASDFGYRFNQITRSYYDHKGGWEGKFRPINYLITGNDVEKFDKEFGKPIGKANALSPKIFSFCSILCVHKTYPIHIVGTISIG